MSRMIDMAGQKCGRLFVLGIAERARNGTSIKWKCVCDCGNEVVKTGNALRNQKWLSCGCLRAEMIGKRFRKHRKGSEKLQDVRIKMIDRCYNKLSPDYQWYGAKGVKVCDEWINDAVSFTEWAFKNGYREGLSIDRINNDGMYEPSNCRWTTDIQQANNRSNNHVISYKGRDYTLSEAARAFNIHVQTLRRRVVHGWSVEDAIEVAPRKGRNQYG